MKTLFTFGLALALSMQLFGQQFYFYRNDAIEVVKSISLRYPWAGGLNSPQISTIDMDFDGIEDLFIFDRTGNKVLTFLYDVPSQQYMYKPEYESKFPPLDSWALLRDYNCDGKKDIFGYVFGGIGVWKNTSSNGELSFEYVSVPYVYTLRPSMPNPLLSNLFVSRVDLPDINDIDGDGDLDVLTFSIIGETLEYHRNMSVENGFGCDSLVFELKNDCWGHFLETGTGTNECILFDTCTSFITAPQLGQHDTESFIFLSDENRAARHSGSSTLSLDLNGDGVRDVLLGDVSFNNVVALYNDNKGVNQNTSMVSQEVDFPNNTIQASIHTFPACYYEDIDKDGKKDLIVSPNIDLQSENTKSVWFYKNYGTNSEPEFQHIKKDLFQEHMIDVGSNAYPVLYDYDGDGLLDLIIGNFGNFAPATSFSYQCKITLYKNTGTASTPAFTHVTDNFLNLSALGFTLGAFPAFADIDNDGDVDLILGDYDGRIHLFTNSSSNANVLTLSLTQPQITDDNGQIIDVGYAAKPQLFDINNDGDLDLIIGEENGNLNYYENVGNANSPIWRLQSTNWGGVDVSEWWTTIGNSSPALFRTNSGVTHLFVGSEKGAIFHYTGIDGNILGTFDEVDTLVGRINIGPNSVPAVGYLNNDTLVDLIVGIKRGGVALYYGSDDISLGNTDKLPNTDLILYPNPVKTLLTIQSPLMHAGNCNYTIFDYLGRTIESGLLTSNTLSVAHLINGLYFLEIEQNNQLRTLKFVKE
jgi:hypothetical protein